MQYQAFVTEGFNATELLAYIRLSPAQKGKTLRFTASGKFAAILVPEHSVPRERVSAIALICRQAIGATP